MFLEIKIIWNIDMYLQNTSFNILFLFDLD